MPDRVLELLQKFVSAYGPPGEEDQIRTAVQEEVEKLGLQSETDAKGNLLVQLGSGSDVIVTAHLDEIAMIVRQVLPDGSLTVGPLGGLFPSKLGEGPVAILADDEPIPGVLGFGSIHSNHPAAAPRIAESQGIGWEQARIVTCVSEPELLGAGVGPGTRVVVHESRRKLFRMGDHAACHFLDDRADLVAWILALETLKDSGVNALFAATAAEEVGGEGAQYLLQRRQPSVCIALELGPMVPDAPIALDHRPTVWVNDSYSAMKSEDIRLIRKISDELRLGVQFQNLSRGGSDASCAAGSGLCARPFTLGLPMENSHGYEIIHQNSISALALLTDRLVKAVG